MEGSADQTTQAISKLSMDSTAEAGASDGAGPQSKKYVFVLLRFLFDPRFLWNLIVVDGFFRETVAVL